MWYLQVTTRPCGGSSLAARYGGATINCWVNTDDEGEAIAVASSVLRRDDWLMDQLVRESCSISRDSQSAKAMPYFDQAEEDGIAYVAFTWPKD